VVVPRVRRCGTDGHAAPQRAHEVVEPGISHFSRPPGEIHSAYLQKLGRRGGPEQHRNQLARCAGETGLAVQVGGAQRRVRPKHQDLVALANGSTDPIGEVHTRRDIRDRQDVDPPFSKERDEFLGNGSIG
jgi:hypothetical protein